MTRSDAEALIEKIYMGSNVLFKYIQEFIPPHYIHVRKDHDGEVHIVREKSTSDIEDFNKETMIRMLTRHQLVEHGGTSWNVDVFQLRNGGCQCGAWATTEPNCHAHWCQKKG